VIGYKHLNVKTLKLDKNDKKSVNVSNYTLGYSRNCVILTLTKKCSAAGLILEHKTKHN